MKLAGTVKSLKQRARSIFTRQASSLSSSFEQSVEIEESLSRSSRKFEEEFLCVLEILEKLQEASEGLGKRCGTMLELSQSEDNPVKRVSEKLAPNLGFIESSARSIASLTQDLESNRLKIEKTLSFEPQLEHTFSQLTYIRTLFTIEAAPLEQHAKVMFTSLVEEINRLQRDVSEIFKDNFKFLRDNHGTIRALCKRLTTQAKDQLSAFERSNLEMDTAIRVLSGKRRQDAAANALLKEHGECIYQSVGNAIISLQTQDIVSQKLEHIYSVSSEMRQRFQAIDTRRGKTERCAEYRFIENAALVILNQIDSIKNELQEADRSIDRSIGEIKQSVGRMESTSDQMDSGKSKSEENGSGLIADLQRTGEMAQQCERFLEQAFKTIEPIRNQTDNVSSTIEKLSSQLHLIGLNAEIHAARTGGSTALETLSAKTSGISVETRDLCANISIQLDGLATALRENVDLLESLLGQAQNTRSQICQDIPVEKENFGRQNQLYHRCHAETQEMMASLSAATQNHESRLEFEATMLKELEAMQSIHKEISVKAKEAADRLKVEIDIPQIMSGVLERYTMKSEQAVHMNTLGLPHPGDERGTDNWEFIDFNCETEESNEPKSRQASTPAIDQGIELF